MMSVPGFNVVDQLQALRRYARSLARNESDAEDLVQQTLVQAYVKRSSFHQGGNLRAWLFGILHNAFISEWRRSVAEARRIQDSTDFRPDHQSPDQEHAVRLAQIREAFFALPEDQRAVLHLVGIEGMSYADASTTLGIPVGTLMSRLSRARAALRDFEQAPSAEGRRIAALRVIGGTDEF